MVCFIFCGRFTEWLLVIRSLKTSKFRQLDVEVKISVGGDRVETK